MESLFVLVPLSVVLVFGIIAVFAWALRSGQLEDVEREGERILRSDPDEVDADQAGR
jgi:cbb3-type cytochrome oxidase maturation protein